MANRSVFASVLFVMLGVALAYGDGGNDVCGDPLPSNDMRSNPMKVVDWLQQQDMWKKVNQALDSHPFIKDIESGKLTKDNMQRFIINMVYDLERNTRTFHGAYNMFATAFPCPETRDMIDMCVEAHQMGLDDLQRLGSKFQLNDIESLLKYEPMQFALQYANAWNDAVMHGEDVADVLVPHVVNMDHQNQLNQRIKKALMSNSAYKAWNLNADDLKIFDFYQNMDRDAIKQDVQKVIRRAIDRDVTLCQLRRRVNALQVGRIGFYDATGRTNNPVAQIEHGF